MPKININEVDKTTAGTLQYENFSVLVPGFLGENPQLDKFDGNGVCELTKTADFDDIVGKTEVTGDTVKAEFAKPKNLSDTAEAERYIAALSAKEFYSEYAGNVYVAKSISRPAEDKGRLIVKIVTQTEESTSEQYYEAEKAQDWDATGNYCVIEPGNEGHDKVAYESDGYKIARKLLDLGYSILYKKLDGENPADRDFWSCMADKANYDFRYIIPGIYDKEVYRQVVDLASKLNIKEAQFVAGEEASGRGDVIALLDVIEADIETKIDSSKNTKIGQLPQAKVVAEAISQVNGWSNMLSGSKGKYAAIFMPRVKYVGDDFYMPASFHYLACGAKAFSKYNEWYAIAGYTRGISDANVESTSVKLGDIAMNALQPRRAETTEDLQFSINPITCERGNYYIWGNRTASKLDRDGLTASHFLNIRQLCCTIKKRVYTACRALQFNPNSDILWVNFCNALRPTLDKMKTDQGMKDYKIVKLGSTTGAKAIMRAKVRIVPIEAVEDFDIGVYLEDSIAGISAEAEE